MAFVSGGRPSGGGGGKRNGGEQAGRGRTTPRAYPVAMKVVVVGLQGAPAQAVGLGHDVPGRGVHREEGERRNGGGKRARGGRRRGSPAGSPLPRWCLRRRRPRRPAPLVPAPPGARRGGRPCCGLRKAAAEISGSRRPRQLHALSQPLDLSTSCRQFVDTTPNEELPTASQPASRGGVPHSGWACTGGESVGTERVHQSPTTSRDT